VLLLLQAEQSQSDDCQKNKLRNTKILSALGSQHSKHNSGLCLDIVVFFSCHHKPKTKLLALVLCFLPPGCFSFVFQRMLIQQQEWMKRMLLLTLRFNEFLLLFVFCFDLF